MFRSAVESGLRFVREKPFQVFLLLVIIAGLLGKLYLSVNLDLTSDTISPGIVAAEMMRHGNPGLQGYTFPLFDSYLYDDILLFHAVPQLISGYDPRALVLTSYFIFLALVVVFTTIAACVTRDLTKTLLFGALLATVSPAIYHDYGAPAMHNATLLLAGVFLLLFLLAGEKRWKLVLPLALVSGIVTFSDSLFLLYLVLPAGICYLSLERKTRESLWGVSLFTGVSLVGYFSKGYLPGFAVGGYDVHLLSPAEIWPQFLAFSSRLSGVLLGAFSLRPQTLPEVFLTCALLTAFIVLVIFAVVDSLRQRSPERRYLQVFFLAGSLAFIAFLAGTSIKMYDNHYLTYLVLMFVLLLPVSLELNWFRAGCFSLLLIAGLFGTLSLALTLDNHPNQEQRELIEFLESKNLTVGYGNYWDANIITYLSGENVTIRAIHTWQGTYVQDHWLSCDRWYQDYPQQFFIVTNTEQDPWLHDLRVPAGTEPEYFYQVGTYSIYVFNQSSLLYGLKHPPPVMVNNQG